VYILGRRQAPLDMAARTHSSLCPLVCDVGSKTSLQAAVDKITYEAGFVNLVIANAGILGPLPVWDTSKPLSELRKALYEKESMDEFTQLMHTNITSAYFTMLAFLELLDAGNKRAVEEPGAFGAPLTAGSKVPSIQSQVVFNASNYAYVRNSLVAPAYAASKAGLTQLAMHAATNLAGHQIRVNTLCPGCK
jgi:NAD(P)-dependent dehydrogenase (short-subunit alcohol dehydrogenase family)